ncbi:hypothetical protein TNCT_351971 [Trichonephila clavata]|uniref:Uncharacterized protein n=1 Tax=Trichonephila clavata TaxID=2740835 RepID=A0A8X6KVX7_TRICU|nr:hypothetical protein TNCT_351971 [Trichonephila clavata]
MNTLTKLQTFKLPISGFGEFQKKNEPTRTEKQNEKEEKNPNLLPLLTESIYIKGIRMGKQYISKEALGVKMVSFFFTFILVMERERNAITGFQENDIRLV